MSRKVGEFNDSHQMNACSLSGDFIGKRIRFLAVDNYEINRDIENVVTAELRQLSHNADETHIVVGLGAEREYTLKGDDVIIFSPLPDYSDVPHLIVVNAERRVLRNQ